MANHISNLFKFKQKITCQTGDNNKKTVKIMVPSKYLSNCEVNIILTWSADCVIASNTAQIK